MFSPSLSRFWGTAKSLETPHPSRFGGSTLHLFRRPVLGLKRDQKGRSFLAKRPLLASPDARLSPPRGDPPLTRPGVLGGGGGVLSGVAPPGAGAVSLHQRLKGQLSAGTRVAAEPGDATWRVHPAGLPLEAGTNWTAATAGLSH